MYLVIHEDGTLQTATSLEACDFEGADNGYLDIIDVTGECPFQYLEGEWHKIDKYN